VVDHVVGVRRVGVPDLDVRAADRLAGRHVLDGEQQPEWR
jgi:hypothetical protein